MKNIKDNLITTQLNDSELFNMVKIGLAAQQELNDSESISDELRIDLEAKVKNYIDAVEIIAQKNYGLVVNMANQFRCKNVCFGDLVQTGLMGLVKAIEKYDPKQGKFSTYACNWIRDSLQTEVASFGRPFKVSNDVYKKITKYYAVSSRLEEELNHTPSLSEVAKEMGVSEEELLQIVDYSSSAVHLDNNASDDGKLTYMDTIQSDMLTPEEEILNDDKLNTIASALSVLSDREKYIIINYFGLDNQDHQTYAEIALSLNVSAECVRRTLNKAITKIKTSKYADDLKSMY